MCDYVFKDISPQEALILQYSSKHNRVIEVVRIPGKWEQPHPPSSYSSSLDKRVPRDDCNKNVRAGRY
jgi:hypothetical protein